MIFTPKSEVIFLVGNRFPDFIFQIFYRNKFQNLYITFLKVCVKNIGLILLLKAGSRIERNLQIFAKSQIQTIFKLGFKIVL